MAPILEQLLLLLSVPQGNMIYALALTMVAFCAWIACIYARGKDKTLSSARMQLGLLVLFLAQLVLFVFSWMAWLGVIDVHLFIPPLDRTLAIFSLVLILWLWAIPEASRVWDAIVTLAEIVVLVFGITGIALWMRIGTGTYFNTSLLGTYSYYSGLGLTGFGIILLVWRRPSYWAYGILMFAGLLAGYLAQMFIRQPASDYTWFVHLSEASFLLLLALPKRLVISRVPPVTTMPPAASSTGMAQLDGKLIQSVTDVIIEPSPQRYYQELTRLVAHVMNAYYCLLIIPPKTGDQLIVPVGYDGIADQPVDGFTADGHSMAPVLQAVMNGEVLRLPSSSSSEANSLVEVLGISSPSHLMVAPFHPTGTSAIMGIAVLSKTSSPAWSEADAAQLVDVTEALIANTGRVHTASKLADQAELMGKLQHAEAYTDQVRLEYAQLKARFDSLAAHVADYDARIENEKVLNDNVDQLERRNRELEVLVARGRPSMEEVEQLRLELRAALGDLARIPSTLSKSDQKMLETQLSAVKSLDKMQPTELVNSIAQEFRQPLSSISGYTDLLLGESVGLLGAAQRKFLERVKASTERLGFLMNELVEVVAIDGGRVDKTPISVELEPVIHEAVNNITAQLNEKNITIQLDLPELLPAIRANKDALVQILENLLENACIVTPADGQISLVARQQYEGEHYFILLSVIDQGGGIDRTDISRVFMRRYKMENPLIQGLGDTGVGLSIVKSLVELLRGRVWVDSQPGGATFSVLLPLTEADIAPTPTKASNR